jgi:methionyl-tRNA formyltransferase
MAAIADGTAEYTPQDSEMATHTAKIYKEMGSIDWSEDAEHIECLIRGLNPWPSAYTKLEDKTFKIWKAQVISHEKIAAPGCIVKVEKDIIYVQAGNGILGLKEVQLEGKKRMSVEAFLNGYVVEEGTYFKKG